MTRKDYELIAAALHRSMMAHGIGKHWREVSGGDKAIRLVGTDLAATIAHDNPAFDKARFLAACGMQS